MDPADARARFAAAEVAHLATAADGMPHLVPITFAADGDTLWFAVDHKPKTTRELRRLRNIRANPRVCVLVDHYEPDWGRLWWVRADGVATIRDRDEAGLDRLVAKYPRYREIRPAGPVVRIDITRWASWSAD
jgi:PPOX class probable F420-dependent enzyme